MINNNTTAAVRKLESTANMVYEAKVGGAYSHHASITYYKGRFWAIWSNGKVNEDDLGQCVMIAESPDGEKWEKLRPVVTPEMIGDETLVLTAAGFYIDGETLHVYYGFYNYGQGSQLMESGYTYIQVHHVGTGLGVISTTDGENWSKPRSLGVPLVPNHGPQKTSTGRIIIAGNTMFPYTDNPNGLEDYKITGIYGDTFGEEPPYDDAETHHLVARFHGWGRANEMVIDDKLDNFTICEGSFYETDDHVLHMMLRSNKEYLWCSESFDDGATWSEPQITGYTDSASKFHFGRLPDGRFYGVSNATPNSGRTPLHICVSEDGVNFDKKFIIRDESCAKIFEGMYKGGLYGYPHTLIHDGYMYVIYSKNKESIEVSKFAIDQL